MSLLTQDLDVGSTIWRDVKLMMIHWTCLLEMQMGHLLATKPVTTVLLQRKHAQWLMKTMLCVSGARKKV